MYPVAKMLIHTIQIQMAKKREFPVVAFLFCLCPLCTFHISFINIPEIQKLTRELSAAAVKKMQMSCALSIRITKTNTRITKPIHIATQCEKTRTLKNRNLSNSTQALPI